jgi:DNA primase
MLSTDTIARARVASDLLRYVERDTGQAYRKAGATDGGEYEGPCPFCGGRDRFRLWPSGDPPRWWCRQCELKGDLIAFVQRRDGLPFADAVTELLGGDVTQVDGPRVALPPTPPDEDAPPPALWRARAQAFANDCYDALWSPAGARARTFLAERYGLSEATLEQAGLGYHAEDRSEPRALWGLPDEPDGRELFLPRGVVVPWEVTGETWRLFVRRPLNDPKRKHYQIPGGANCPYRADALSSRRPVMLVEAALDALAVHQVAGDLVAAVAVGTTGARRVRWIMRMAQAPAVLLSFDADDGGATPTRYWSEVLEGTVPWPPYYDDPAAMLRDGMDVRAWVEAGLAYAAECAARRNANAA